MPVPRRRPAAARASMVTHVRSTMALTKKASPAWFARASASHGPTTGSSSAHAGWVATDAATTPTRAALPAGRG